MTAELPKGDILAPHALAISQAFAAAPTVAGPGDRSAQIDKIELLFGLQGEPFCAMGTAYCYLKAIAQLTGRPTDHATLSEILAHELPRYFNPSPSCSAIIASAREHGAWTPYSAVSPVLPGDLVFYNWQGGTTPQHVGMFIRHTATGITACEWNTTDPAHGGNQSNGHGVFVRQRAGHYILGSVRVNTSGLPRAA